MTKILEKWDTPVDRTRCGACSHLVYDAKNNCLRCPKNVFNPDEKLPSNFAQNCSLYKHKEGSIK